MHVQRHGTGEPVSIALHGWGGSHLTYAPLVPFMPRGSTLLALDLPGYGRSPRVPARDAEALASAIHREIDTLDVGRYTLVGNCSGAVLAALCAGLAGARLDRLVLIDPFAFVPWYFRVFLTPPIGRVAYYSTFANPAGRWLTNLSLASRRTSSSHLTSSFKTLDHDVSLDYLSMLARIGSVERFAGISVPVDIVYGERTFAAVKRSLPLWRQVLPQARFWPIRRAGHLPIDEAPQSVAAILFDAVPPTAHGA